MLDVQADLIARLSAQFPDAEVCSSPSDPITMPTITVRREGGPRLNKLLDRPGVGLEVYGATEASTSDLANDVADFMSGLTFSDGYALVEMETMRSSPDLDTKQPCWYLSYTITTYEKEN